MIKGFKIRLYPNKEQEKIMWEHIYGCRYLWNYMLALQESRYQNKKKYLSAYDMINTLPTLKNDGEHNWLKSLSSHSLKFICHDLDKAYKLFFQGINEKPQFKTKKRGINKFPIRQDVLRINNNGEFCVEKIGKVRFKSDHQFKFNQKGIFLNPRISFIDGKWYLSFSMNMETRNNIPCFNK